MKLTPIRVLRHRGPRFFQAGLAGLLLSSVGVFVGAFVAGQAIDAGANEPSRVVVSLDEPIQPCGHQEAACPRCEDADSEDDTAPSGVSTPDGALPVMGCEQAFVGRPWRGAEDTGRPYMPLEVHRSYDDWTPRFVPGVAVSRGNFGVVATWHGQSAFVSRDDGQSFRAVAGDSSVVDVAVGARGTVFVLRVDGLQVLGADGNIHFRQLPCTVSNWLVDDYAVARSWIVVESGYLAVLCAPHHQHDGMAISRNNGRTWVRRSIPYEGFNTFDNPVDESNAIDVAISRSGQITLLKSGPDFEGEFYGAFWRSEGPRLWGDAEHIFGDAHLGHDGTVYFVSFGCDYYSGQSWESTGLGSLDGDRQCRRLAPIRHEYTDLLVAHNGRATVGVVDGRLYRLQRRRATLLSDSIPAHLVGIGVDSCGRTLGVAQHQVVRWQEEGGWHVLFEWPPLILDSAPSGR